MTIDIQFGETPIVVMFGDVPVSVSIGDGADIVEAIGRLDDDLETERGVRGGADSAEMAARVAADSALQTNIIAEAVARSLADGILQVNINAEAATRGSADTTLQVHIDAEEAARIAADALKLDTSAFVATGITNDTTDKAVMIGGVLTRIFFPLRDAAGNAVLFLDRSLTWWMHGLRVAGNLITDTLTAATGAIGSLTTTTIAMDSDSIDGRKRNYDWWIGDVAGNAVAGVIDNDFHLMHVGASVRLRMLFADAANQARSRSIMETPHNLGIAALDATRALVMLYGQSLATADEAWPAITKTARHPMAYMIGSSVRPRTAGTAAWQQIGAAQLNPLIATVEAQVNSGRAPLSDSAVAALTPGIGAEGESPVIAVVNQMAKAWTGRGDAPARKFVGVVTAVSGQTIEQLSKGASPNYYQRNVDAVTLHQSLATAASETANVAAICYMQGEFNYSSSFGGTTDKGAYKALLIALRSDLNGDIVAVTAQSAVPAMLIYVTSATFVSDAAHASISMAQVEFAQENPGVFCVGPTYPVTDKGGHLDSNGSRWFGSMLAKVARRVIVDRLGWEPLYPRLIEAIGKDIFLHFHVPAGPLQWQPAYVASVATIYDDRGFRVEDAGGFVSFGAPEIIGSTIVRLPCNRAVDPATAFVWYADRTLHSGGGNLCDSDPARSDEVYEYLVGTGMYAAADIAELVERPYRLFNWCPPFRLAVGYSRP